MYKHLHLIPLHPLRILPYIRHKILLHLISHTRSYLEDNFVQPSRPENVDVVAGVRASADEGGYRQMGKLQKKKSVQSMPGTRPNARRRTDLDRLDINVGGVPPWPLPTLNTHSAQADKADRPIAFPQSYPVDNLDTLSATTPTLYESGGSAQEVEQYHSYTRNQSNLFLKAAGLMAVEGCSNQQRGLRIEG